MKIFGTPVIAQPFPEFKHLGKRRLGQRFYIRESIKPAVIIRDDGFHLRLLEHDFRNPYPVRIAGVTPGKRPLVFFVPGQQFFGKRRQFHVGIILGKGCP